MRIFADWKSMKEALNIDQELQTVQRLSPRQVQFVHLLEMSAPELEEEVRRQLDDNPALETVDSDMPAGDADPAPDAAAEEYSTEMDPDDDPADYALPRSSVADTGTMAPQYADDGPDLYDWLRQQLSVLDLDERTRQIAQYIIGNIDENGYLTRRLSAMADDIAINTGIEVADAQMQEAFNAVRQLDPPGICAVDLRDCLLLQLRRRTPSTLTLRIAKDIVENNFDLFSKMHYDRLKAQVGISDTQLREAIDLIRSLNPKPGNAAGGDASMRRAGHITPDIAVDVTDDGRFTVYPVSSVPRLQIERSFAVDSPLATAGGGAAARRQQAQSFIRMKRDDAEAFITALRMRSETLLNVTEAIVKLQRDFFLTGNKSLLRPMILKDVAALTGYDISVISRATAGKYVATPTGTYPLKMFFNEAPKENSDTSSHQIQHRLRQIIDAEDKRHPLSDEAISRAMAEAGFDVARRTVTKYREKMGIPVGRLRKEV